MVDGNHHLKASHNHMGTRLENAEKVETAERFQALVIKLCIV